MTAPQFLPRTLQFARTLGKDPHARRTRWLACAAARLSGPRAGYRDGTAVLLLSSMSWLAGAVVLAAALELAGLAIPWRGLLFAYGASQVGGGLVPLPGGLGGVEGGLLGALALAGSPLTAALATAVIVYGVVGYWAVILAGAVAAAAMTRRRLRTQRPGLGFCPEAGGQAR